MKVEKKYPYLFFAGDYSEMKPALEDVFYEKNGQLFSQFYKGQLIPIEIWNEVFVKDEEISVEPEPKEVEKVETKIDKEKKENDQKKEKKEVKLPKKRRKSIIKK